MQLDMFPELEEEKEQEEEKSSEPTLEQLEEIHGVFPGSPGWTDEMESERLKMIKELDKHAHVLLKFQDGHQERVSFYGHEYIQGLRLLRRGNVFSLEKLRELEVRTLTLEAKPEIICLNKRGCTCQYKHIDKLQDIKTCLPELDLDNI